MIGKLIAIEGTDGTGKKTQTQLLAARLSKEGHKVATFPFPQYGKKSAGLVEEYLNKKYGDPKDVNPYATSLFYAVDRFDVSKDIKEARDRGEDVLFDRYVDSNAGHQGGKIKDLHAREEFIKWLYKTEYEILGVPKPDLVIILHVPAEIGQAMVFKKETRKYLEKGTHDGHEADLDHLKNAEASYLWVAKEYPKDHKVIECIRDGKLLSPQEIHEMVYETVKPLL